MSKTSDSGSGGKRPAGNDARGKPGRDEILARLAALSVPATSPDGSVALAVNADGVLTRLRLSDAVNQQTPADIANNVLQAYAQAQRASAHRSRALLASLGADGHVMDQLRRRMAFQPEFASAPQNRREAADYGAPAGPEATTNPFTAKDRRKPRDTEYEYLKDRSFPGYRLVPPVPDIPEPEPPWDGESFRAIGER